MKIECASVNFLREPLLSPFGFKGRYLSELWQTKVKLTDTVGASASGTGIQSVLWSDTKVFTEHSEAAGNAMMLLSTEEASRFAAEAYWADPIELQEKIFDNSHRRAEELTGRGKSLRETFTLNSMVALDNAAWLLRAKKQGCKNFDEMIPEPLKGPLSFRHDRIASVPLVTYGVDLPEVERLLEDGACLLKIKIGSDPEKDGDPEKMLAWDKQRLSQIHELADRFLTDYTDSEHVLYYLDANGRYDSLERVSELLGHAKKIGALDRILLFEEPFPEDMKFDVSSLPVRIAADESAHSARDVEERIGLGYGAIALKPIAKTLSATLKMLKVAHVHGVSCFCADLTVTPELVEWNKNVAARIAPLPGMKIGVLESNGPQNYKNWKAMMQKHPFGNCAWAEPHEGVFVLDEGFYEKGGGIFDW